MFVQCVFISGLWNRWNRQWNSKGQIKAAPAELVPLRGKQTRCFSLEDHKWRLTVYWVCTPGVFCQAPAFCSLLAVTMTSTWKAPPRPHPPSPSSQLRPEVSLLSLSSFPHLTPGTFLPEGFWSVRWHFHGLPWNIDVEFTFLLSCAASRQRSVDKWEGQHPPCGGPHLLLIRLSERQRQESLSQQHNVHSHPNHTSSPPYWQSNAVFTDPRTYTCGVWRPVRVSGNLMIAKPNCSCAGFYNKKS